MLLNPTFIRIPFEALGTAVSVVPLLLSWMAGKLFGKFKRRCIHEKVFFVCGVDPLHVARIWN